MHTTGTIYKVAFQLQSQRKNDVHVHKNVEEEKNP